MSTTSILPAEEPDTDVFAATSPAQPAPMITTRFGPALATPAAIEAIREPFTRRTMEILLIHQNLKLRSKYRELFRDFRNINAADPSKR